MEILYTALAMGLMGSFHCVGMCGPIALSLPLNGNTIVQKILAGLLYNFGRATTYGLMGSLFGLIGFGFHLLGFQQWISIFMGALMIVSVLFPVFFKKKSHTIKFPFTDPVRKGIQHLFRERSFVGLFFIGMLNGLLPCGLVYLAIAGAIGAGGVVLGALFMLAFGLGTIPMLLFISLLGGLIGHSLRSKINKLIPFVVVLVGLIFILRGLSLGIPFLSPPKEKLTPINHQKALNCDSISSKVEHSCCQGK